ncbi:class I SAM-dependent methyltransferase [Candidatus Pelagibacter sp.]|nr:class I SAM-dependent methyltransferase [Candidatus Pelagibacter sp.]
MENLNFFKLFFFRIYHFLFIERFSKKLSFNFPENIFRWNLIQLIIDKNNFVDYLEIGCDKNQSFSKIIINNKVGVDPVSGGTIRSTSDDFFLKNLNNNYDVIFIDGLHYYEQVLKDIKNSLKILNNDGFILVHDCLPISLAHQAVPRYRGSWNGDVWKSIVELRNDIDLDVITCEIDFGVAIIRKRKNQNPLNFSQKNFKFLKFRDYFYNHKKLMNIKNYNDTLIYLNLDK